MYYIPYVDLTIDTLPVPDMSIDSNSLLFLLLKVRDCPHFSVNTT